MHVSQVPTPISNCREWDYCFLLLLLHTTYISIITWLNKLSSFFSFLFPVNLLNRIYLKRSSIPVLAGFLNSNYMTCYLINCIVPTSLFLLSWIRKWQIHARIRVNQFLHPAIFYNSLFIWSEAYSSTDTYIYKHSFSKKTNHIHRIIWRFCL